MSIDLTRVTWRKASYSNPTGACVEAASALGRVLVRDAAQPGTGPVLRITVADWRRFTELITR
jgi:hypothetical protein